MTALLLPVALLSAGLQAGEFLALMRKADGRAEPQEKIEYYSRALKAWTPQDGQALLANCRFRRGEALFDLGKPQQSLPDFDKALDLDPRNARAYLLRGKTHLMGGRFKKAAADLKEYADLAPEDMDGLLSLGEAQRRAGEASSALSTYRKAALLEPADFRPSLGEGLTYATMGRWPQAKVALDAADSLARHRDPETLSLRAAARTALNEMKGALQDYNDSLPLHEERLLDLQRASAPSLEIAQQRNKTAAAYYERGRLHERLLRPNQAASDYERSCRLGREDACSKILQLRPRKRPAAPKNDPGSRIYAN